MTSVHIKALELISLNDWSSSHELIQNHSDELSCLIHGYLHWIEGDLTNANYWYRRAGHTFPSHTLVEEFERINQLAKNQP
jgi:hypothetical protein